MAAYAALVSLEHIIDSLEHHSRPPISIHKEQVNLLTERITFLQQFLRIYNPTLDYSKEADQLEGRIARAAYAAEDAIESHIYDQFTNKGGEKASSDGLYKAIEKVIEDMALIERVAMEISKETLRFQKQMQDFSWSSSSSSIAQKKSMMVGANDLLLEMKSRLTAHARDLQTLPIVGMGGSGKTTLALNIYEDGLIKEHFDIRAWVTISQEYSILETLIQLLTQLNNKPDQSLSEGELGEMLHKYLYGRKFMIILDDMWSIEAWDAVTRFLPNNKNGSRIVITTRLTNLASVLPNSNSLGMKLLDDDDSWDLLSKTVFGEKSCPPGFEKIGKRIGKGCKGLPLSIVVVGGLLAKSGQTTEYWENMEENLNAIVNLDDDERCSKTLYMSYKQLPVHLKPCFLYMGIYCEDHVILVSTLIRLWVAEGFLKPVGGKRLEDVARVYLEDLIDRNLILVHEVGSIGSIKECKVHDLLRDLCLREARKQGFYTVYSGHEIRDELSRIVISHTIPNNEEALSSSAPLARSLFLAHYGQDFPPHISRQQLRIISSKSSKIAAADEFTGNVHQLVNSRFFSLCDTETEFPNLIWQFWNLQTVIAEKLYEVITVPTDVWYMSHIRHLCVYRLYFPDPPPNALQDGIGLANLQTLGCIINFRCSEQMVKAIPNIRKLDLLYVYDEEEGVDDDSFSLSNLDCLDKLESLICCFSQFKCPISYPQSLKKLTLGVHYSQCWPEYTLDTIGALPLLEKLKLYDGTFEEQWETSDGQFRSLKFLSLSLCDLRAWTSEASHFPRLEQLHLYGVRDLEEIPSDFADISTLRLINLELCSDSIFESAKGILEEQEALYGEEETTLEVQVSLSWKNDPVLVDSFRSRNFHVR